MARPRYHMADVWHAENTQAEITAGRRMVNSVSFPYYLDLPYGWFNLRATYENTPEIPHIDAASAKICLAWKRRSGRNMCLI